MSFKPRSFTLTKTSDSSCYHVGQRGVLCFEGPGGRPHLFAEFEVTSIVDGCITITERVRNAPTR